jgi:cytochrome c oxidase subunit IV
VDVCRAARLSDEHRKTVKTLRAELREEIGRMENQTIYKGIGRYIPIYITLLLLSGLQVFLAYTKLDRNRLLAALLAVALFSAALAVMYFMHMINERRSFFWSLIPATIFVLLMMNMIWSDSFRLLHMRPF